MTKAEIVCDSVSPDGVRLTTFVVTFHRFVLAEFNTHRVFSRNSASSRAIPSSKMIERVETNPAVPVSWGSNKPGMQAGEELQDNDRAECTASWLIAARDSIGHVKHMLSMGLHKQVANRLLEPFNWHTAIVTAVDFDNFFWQRCHPDAQPEMKAVADAMQEQFYTHAPAKLDIGEWHLPFITESDKDEVWAHDSISPFDAVNMLRQLSVARCARVSYLNHDGVRALDDDWKLFDRLVQGSHWSPFEHIATPCTHINEIDMYYEGEVSENDTDPLDLHLVCRLTGNFGHGWHQYRKFFSAENRRAFIPNLESITAIE